MNFYDKKSRWKIYLTLTAIVIVSVSLLVSNYLANRIAEGEKRSVQLMLQAYQSINIPSEIDAPIGGNTDLALFVLEKNTTIPIIVLNGSGEIEMAANFGEELDYNFEYLEGVLKAWRKSGAQPEKLSHELGSYYIYYSHSWLLSALKYFPILNFLLIGSFIAIAYLLFSSSRRAEQNRVWVGMAKETAHQLGTPISGIMAWIEHLKLMESDNPEMKDIVTELTKDVQRLDLVADRFSKIGSEPELKEANAFDVLERNFKYMEKRSPRKVNFIYPPRNQEEYKIYINGHLFDWVVENLLRNALDAMGGKGEISAEIYDDNKFIYFDLIDSGKGIPSSKFKTIFQPGYTTKKRGWGLGLSLTKRIIESYHSGKIFVKKSIQGEGTTFTIQLPKK